MKYIDEILDSFAKKIQYVRRGPVGVPKMFTIDLGVAIVDQVFNISGNMFRIWSAPDESSYVTVKINESGEPAVPYQVHTGAKTPFDKLLITTPAGQAGDMIIIYGTEAPDLLEMIDDRSTSVAGVGGVLDELRGDLVAEAFTGIAITAAPGATPIMAARADRKSCIVQALSTNTGSVFRSAERRVYGSPNCRQECHGPAMIIAGRSMGSQPQPKWSGWEKFNNAGNRTSARFSKTIGFCISQQ